MIYWAKKNMSNVQVKSYLSKKHYDFIISTNKLLQNVKSVKFPYIDANCRPKINWSDDLIDDNFSHSLHELKNMIVRLTGCGNVLLFLIYSYFLL